jgi:hypothetical protein
VKVHFRLGFALVPTALLPRLEGTGHARVAWGWGGTARGGTAETDQGF